MKLKAFIISIIFIFTFNVVKSQNQKNELKINLFSAILGMPEVDYEHQLPNNCALGLALAFSTEKIETMPLRSLALPYFRTYFGNNTNNGFYLEANCGIVNEKRNYTETQYNYDSFGNYVGYTVQNKADIVNSFVFGAAFGFKAITKNGLVGDIFVGGGRLYDYKIDKFFPRVGISIGKRF